MKNAISKIFQGLAAIIIVFLVFVGAVILLPFDYIKYKRSHYCKIEHKKYRLFAGCGPNFEIYNAVIENNLPIKFIPNPDEESLESGCFVYGKTLIVPSGYSFEYDNESGGWNYVYEEDGNEVVLTVEEYLKGEIRDTNEAFGENTCENAVILLDGNATRNADKTTGESRIIVYEDNIAKALEILCGR